MTRVTEVAMAHYQLYGLGIGYNLGVYGPPELRSMVQNIHGVQTMHYVGAALVGVYGPQQKKLYHNRSSGGICHYWGEEVRAYGHGSDLTTTLDNDVLQGARYGVIRDDLWIAFRVIERQRCWRARAVRNSRIGTVPSLFLTKDCVKGAHNLIMKMKKKD
eukprot:scaffold7102_cov34-Attheya_sp.AAC.6